jgi:Protein of unknown function (DUF2804)
MPLVALRELTPAPASFLDPETGEPAWGSYMGPLPAVTLPGAGFVDRIARRKRWVYVAVRSADVWIAFAVVRTGYAASAFGFAFDLREGRMLVEKTAMGPAFAGSVTDAPNAHGSVASFSFAGTELGVERGASGMTVRAKLGDMDLEAVLDDRSAPPAITAIAKLPSDRGLLLDATEKRALADVRGRARLAGREVSLDGAVAGYDYTHGLLPRHTQWRWAFALGADVSGQPFGLNVVQGFVGEAECAAFTRSAVHPLAEPAFDFDASAPMKPWRLSGDGIDLVFTPGAVHAQHTNLGVVRSRFLQPVGTFNGSVRVAGKDIRVAELAGVVEDQDVVW